MFKFHVDFRYAANNSERVVFYLEFLVFELVARNSHYYEKNT